MSIFVNNIMFLRLDLVVVDLQFLHAVKIMFLIVV